MPGPKHNSPLGLEEAPSPVYVAEPRSETAFDNLEKAAEANAAFARVTPGALAELSRHGYSDDEIWRLVVPRRTLARRQAAHEPLTIEETDKALRLHRIALHAERVFGDPEKAYRWLRRPKIRFEGANPVDYLASEAGARAVEEWLVQIDYGMVA